MLVWLPIGLCFACLNRFLEENTSFSLATSFKGRFSEISHILRLWALGLPHMNMALRDGEADPLKDRTGKTNAMACALYLRFENLRLRLRTDHC